MKRPLLLATVLAAAGSLAAGYALGRASVSPGLLARERGEGPAVATFRGGAVTRAQVVAALEKQPEAYREQLRSPGAKKALVEEMVRVELLAREGERRGHHRDPEFLRRYKDDLGRTFLEKELEAPQRKAAPADAELRAFYDRHREALARPERARIAVVQYAAPTGDAGARAARRAKAEAALARLRGAREPHAFARVAAAESDHVPSRLANGELPFLTRGEIAERLGPEVADAAFALARAGDLAPAAVEGARGFHVVKLLGREDGYQPSFEEMKPAIRERLVAERRSAAHDAFLKALWDEAEVRLDEKQIEALRVE
ncbi:MAG TPA: peptidylprolyl isomerase [Anaeromyxobacteraceae bacterium]|nr:peptidylprolyl isomerase [Anaeromyxobacteraceae bacterium]